MSFIFKPPKAPDVPVIQPISVPTYTPPPVAAATVSPEVKEVQETEAEILEEEKKKIRQGKTQKATILTGSRGLLEPAVVKRKTLLGI